jgi:hypothetical protein
MNEGILLVILIGVVVGFGIALYLLAGRLRDLKGHGSVDLLKADMTELSRGISNLQQVVGDKLERNNASMQT